VIGQSRLVGVDPSMGVATGYLERTTEYSKFIHAFSVDGESQEHPAEIQLANMSGAEIPTRAVAIHDFEGLGEIEVHVFFNDPGQFEALFLGT